MKTTIENIINRIEAHKEYIYSEDYSNSYGDTIGDSLQYYSPNVSQWLKENIDEELTQAEQEELEYDLCSNSEHLLILEDGIEFDERAIISWPIYEEEIDFQEYLPELDQDSDFFNVIMEYIENKTDVVINDSSPGFAYLNMGYAHVKLIPNVETLKETLKDYRAENLCTL
jgi:hypothetical protein